MKQKDTKSLKDLARIIKELKLSCTNTEARLVVLALGSESISLGRTPILIKEKAIACRKLLYKIDDEDGLLLEARISMDRNQIQIRQGKGL